MRELVYILPAHNEEAVLAKNVARVIAELERTPGGAIIVVENGSRDRTWDVLEDLVRKHDALPTLAVGKKNPVSLRGFKEPNAGIGYAYHRGLTEAVAAFGPAENRWAVLTAVDLPFGFSDLEEAERHFDTPSVHFMIGSKAHPKSRIVNPLSRRAMTLTYRIARRVVLGMRVGDSQGSLFLRLDLVEKLLPKIEARGFFYTTELCHHAERAGERILEVPIGVEGEQRASSVRPWKHGTEMAKQLWALRQRTM